MLLAKAEEPCSGSADTESRAGWAGSHRQPCLLSSIRPSLITFLEAFRFTQGETGFQ